MEKNYNKASELIENFEIHFNKNEINKIENGIQSEPILLKFSDKEFMANIALDKTEDKTKIQIFPYYLESTKPEILSIEERHELMNDPKATLLKPFQINGVVTNIETFGEEKDKLISVKNETSQKEIVVNVPNEKIEIGEKVSLELTKNKDEMDIYILKPYQNKENVSYIIQYNDRTKDFDMLNTKKVDDIISINNTTLRDDQIQKLKQGAEIKIHHKDIKIEPANNLLNQNVLVLLKNEDDKKLILLEKTIDERQNKKEELTNLLVELKDIEKKNGISEESKFIESNINERLDKGIEVDNFKELDENKVLNIEFKNDSSIDITMPKANIEELSKSFSRGI